MRPGLQRMLAAARSGAIDVLVISHLYSLSRTTRHLTFLLNELTARGVRIVSAADPDLDTEATHGRFLMRVMSAVAETEHTGALAGKPQRHRKIRRDQLRRPTPSPSRPTHKEVS